MTHEELRTQPGYIEAMEKIKRYRPGFRFTINFSRIPTAKANGLRYVLQDACKLGLIKSVSIGLGWDDLGNFGPLDETYQRTEVQV